MVVCQSLISQEKLNVAGVAFVADIADALNTASIFRDTHYDVEQKAAILVEDSEGALVYGCPNRISLPYTNV